jgi:hypothetical protein
MRMELSKKVKIALDETRMLIRTSLVNPILNAKSSNYSSRE